MNVILLDSAKAHWRTGCPLVNIGKTAWLVATIHCYIKRESKLTAFRSPLELQSTETWGVQSGIVVPLLRLVEHNPPEKQHTTQN